MPKRRLSDRGDEGRSDESSEDSLGRSEDRPNGKAVRHEGAPTQIKVERILGAKMLPFREKGLSVAWLDLQEQQGAEGQEPVEETTKEPYAPRSLYFLVKYEGFAHVNNEWVRKSHLHKLCELKLRNFMRKYGNPTDLRLDEPRWYRAEKLISRRPLTRVWSTLVEQPAWSSDRHTKDYQWLVKWSGLGYDSATWEDWSDQLEQILVNFENLRARWEKENRESKKRVECLLKRREAERSSGAGFLARARLVDKLMPLEEQPAWLCGGSLHPHQLEALNFLRLSYSRLENVVLADEMGLGKTISAISYVLALIHECSVMEPCLIVAPLSTIPNWEKELERWAPGVDAVTYHGNAEARRVIQEHEFDTGPGTRRARTIKPRVVLTTYEMIVSDTPVFRAVQWESLVVDEGHRLKNAQSKLSMRLNKLKIRHRVLLTGTPLQNNLTELFHLMAFVRPDLFPSLEDFQRQFSELKHEEQVESLKKRVAPHMLRRLKKDVMKDIPTRVERMVPVSLTSIQKAYYTAILTKNFKLLTHGTKGVPRLQNLVMQLRKVCNHPYLIPGTEPHHEMPKRRAELRINASGKLHLLDRMLTRLRKDGHRVLVFSQMTTMLDVLEDYIAHKFGQEAYERVDGSVPSSARQSRIARFNASGPEKFVFLLSTRACGLGLNLTSADTVVIFDSDWNPHNDIQAMSRAHRIGQKRQVVVYRLFCRGSVEERMLQLARKKMALDSMFLQSKNDSKHSAMVMEDIVRWGTEELFSSKEGSIGAKAEAGDGGECQGLRDLDEIGLEKLLDRSVPAGDPSRHDEAEDSREGLGAVLTDKAWELDEDIQQEAEHVIETADGFWEALLAERYEALEAEEHLELGKGKRTKKVVSYKEGGVRKPREEHEEQDWLDTAEAQVMIEENTHEDEELIHSQEEPQSDCLKEPPSTSATAERNTQHSIGVAVHEDQLLAPRSLEPKLAKPVLDGVTKEHGAQSQEEPQSDCLKEPPSTSATAERNTQHSTGVAVHEDQFLAPRSLEPKLANPILYGLTNEHGKNLSLSLAVIHIRFIGILKYELRTELRFQALAHQSMIVVAMILLVQPLEHRGKPVTKGVLAAILLLVATSGGRSPSSRLIGSLSTTLVRLVLRL